MSVFKIFNTVMGSLFKKPATLMYPVVPREWQERTRGHIDIAESDCILCGMCQRKCPTNAITVDRKGRTWTIERMKCIQCACCVETCPKTCLTMAQTYTAPSVTKTVDVFDIPEQEKKAAGAAPSDDAKLQCNKDECVYCGLCAKNCPQDAIKVDRAEKIWEVNDDCVKCGICVEKCPKKCLEIK